MRLRRSLSALTGLLALTFLLSGCSRLFLGRTTVEELKQGALDRAVVVDDGDGAVRLADTHLLIGADTSGDYNRGQFYYGTWTSPFEDTIKFDQAIPSWEAVTPPGTWIRMEIRIRYGEKFTPWYNLGVWASSGETVTRHSVAGQRDRFAQVLTDTLSLRKQANQVQYRVTLFTERPGVTPVLHGVGLSLTHTGAKIEDGESSKEVWGSRLEVPARTQWEAETGEGLAAPAAVTMVLAYFAGLEGRPEWDLPVDEVAEGVFDAAAGHHFNLSFNVAFASSLGLSGRVHRFETLNQAEYYLEREMPVVLVLAYDEGELPGAPLASAEHHAVVLKGFTAAGDPIVNDPGSSSEAEAERTYPRKALEAAWRSTYGTVLLIHPPEWMAAEEGSDEAPATPGKEEAPAAPPAGPDGSR